MVVKIASMKGIVKIPPSIIPAGKFDIGARVIILVKKVIDIKLVDSVTNKVLLILCFLFISMQINFVT